MIEISEHPVDQFHLQDDISGQEQPEIASKIKRQRKNFWKFRLCGSIRAIDHKRILYIIPSKSSHSTFSPH
jgi:hypothetical protein